MTLTGLAGLGIFLAGFVVGVVVALGGVFLGRSGRDD